MKKKLFLLPGLAGVALLLICCFCFLSSKPLRYREITLILLPQKLPEWMDYYPKPYTEIRNYHEIHFTGNRDVDTIKLEYARIRIREIIQQADSINGIHFTFGDSTKINIFIHTLDLLYQERAQRYILDKGEIWFYERMEFGEPTFVCGTPFPTL